LWNITFLVSWCVFFAYAVVELFYLRNWLMLTASAAIGLIGAIPQFVWLVRVSIWLNRFQSPPDM
jgi:hypothetical protein